jgi:hypothetical protein
MEISITAALTLTCNGKLLIHKPWGMGYQRLNANKHGKMRENSH